MNRQRRPAVTADVAAGLNLLIPLAGELLAEPDLPKRQQAELAAAAKYLRQLRVWYQTKQRRKGLSGGIDTEL